MGLIKPTKGKLYVDDKEINELINLLMGQISRTSRDYFIDESIKRNIALVFQIRKLIMKN